MTPISPTSPAQPYVFVSYARGDTYDFKLAERLEKELETRRIKVFRDLTSLQIGDVWPEKLYEAIARITHFVVILSAESEKSDWVRREIEAAVARPREELRIIGIRRSTTAKFPQLADINATFCDVGDEIETVLRVLHLPWGGVRVPASSFLRESRTESRLLAQLCDRTETEGTFRASYREFLRARSSVPQAHFIVGKTDEEHDSLVERLIRTYLEDEARTLADGEATPVYVSQIDWPKKWTIAHGRAQLIASVFDTFFKTYSRNPRPDLKPRTFAAKIGESLPSVAALVHPISEKQWTDQTPKLLTEYLRFWRDVGACDGRRLFFLFFNVEVCHAQREEDVPPDCGKCGPVYARIASFAKASQRPKATAIPSTFLPLECVKQLDVRRWFGNRDDEIAAQCDAVCAALFATGEHQPMEAIEKALRDVQIAHLRRAS